MTWLMDILRGVVIGIANVIPGVSGGTMAVSMGIYDKFIHAVTNPQATMIMARKCLKANKTCLTMQATLMPLNWA